MSKKDLSVLNEQLMKHITGGASGEEFTSVYDRKTKKQRGAVDDSQGNIIRYLDFASQSDQCL